MSDTEKPLGEKKVKEFFEQLFKDLDVNNDGDLTTGELKERLGQSNSEVAKELCGTIHHHPDSICKLPEFMSVMQQGMAIEGLDFDTLTATHTKHVHKLLLANAQKRKKNNN